MTLYTKVLATAASAVLALTLAPAAPAAAAKPVIEIVKGYSATVNEKDSEFICPAGEVLIGRKHEGDENGSTTYWCGRIWIGREQVTVSTNHYQQVDHETYSWFEAPESNAMVGRRHDGDENGLSVAYFALLTWQGRPVTLVNKRWSQTYRESGHESRANPGEIMTGRKHFGDENGDTSYQYALVSY
ncbi:hypothetical protein [Nonomuraea sp. NPDC050783]|uniref:hypothetical protein n=1 Tax=Nonomuraea sp. NPDC050783 TaxID=3154634 RepID=UPI003466A5F8